MPNPGFKYLREANRQFLADLGFQTPAEAVEAGAKTVSQWCELLNTIRSAHETNTSGVPSRSLFQLESND